MADDSEEDNGFDGILDALGGLMALVGMLGLAATALGFLVALLGGGSVAGSVRGNLWSAVLTSTAAVLVNDEDTTWKEDFEGGAALMGFYTVAGAVVVLITGLLHGEFGVLLYFVPVGIGYALVLGALAVLVSAPGRLLTVSYDGVVWLVGVVAAGLSWVVDRAGSDGSSQRASASSTGTSGETGTSESSFAGGSGSTSTSTADERGATDGAPSDISIDYEIDHLDLGAETRAVLDEALSSDYFGLEPASTGPLVTEVTGRWDGGPGGTTAVRIWTLGDGIDPEPVEESFVDGVQTWSVVGAREHVADVVDWGRDPRPWVITELPAGEPLLDAVDGLGSEKRLDTVDDLTDAIEAARQYNVAHFYLDPGCVHVARDGATVSDWGILTRIEEATTDGVVSPYTAPEQIDPDALGVPGRWTDVYRLGAVAYRLVCDRPPILVEQASDPGVVVEETPPPPSEVAGLPSEVDEPFRRVLATDPDERYEQPQSFAIDLRRALGAI